jgi:hypothetical protein
LTILSPNSLQDSTVNQSNYGIQRNNALIKPSATFVLLSFLCTASLLNQAHAQSASRLQPLLNDTVAQFKIVYRHDETEMRRRYVEVSKVLAAWREADRTDENNRRLEGWLRGTIRSSMPGSHAELPPVPTFEDRPAPALPATRAPENSLLPESVVGKLPTPTTLRATGSNTPITPPQSEPDSQPVNVGGNKPIIRETPATPTETVPSNMTGTPVIEAPANDELPNADALPEMEEAPTDELPEVDELPEIEEVSGLIEALGDPFLDDAESAQ